MPVRPSIGRSCGCSWRSATCRTLTTAGRKASRRYWISWRRAVASSSARSAKLLPRSFDLHQLAVLRGRLRALAARPADRRGLLDHRRLGRRLRAVGLDHHQAGALEQLLGIDTRLLGPRRGGGPFLARRSFLACGPFLTRWPFFARRSFFPYGFLARFRMSF